MDVYCTPAYASEIEAESFFTNDAITEEIPIVTPVRVAASVNLPWIALFIANALLVFTGIGFVVFGQSDSEYEPSAYEACTRIAYKIDDTPESYLMSYFKCDSSIANEILAHPTPQPKRREYILQLQELISPLEAGSNPGHDPLNYCQVIMGGFFRELGPTGDGRIVASYHAPPYTSLIPGSYPDCSGGEIILRSAKGFK